ncbi:MAG TPA: protein kinase, partial [Polyangiales bacterium]|nr:protein kinase [Polyangiales bacterium]
MADREELRAAAEGRIGQLVNGKFRLLRLLGVGGMAAVYEAAHRNGKRVALKMLHASLSQSERQRKRFAREAYVANTIGHPGVVQIHDDGVSDDGTAYLVME